MGSVAAYMIANNVSFTYNAQNSTITYSPAGLSADLLSGIALAVNNQGLSESIIIK